MGPSSAPLSVPDRSDVPGPGSVSSGPLAEDSLARIRRTWEGVVGCPSGLTGTGLEVVAQQGKRDPSQEWIRIVCLMGATVVSTPPSRVAGLRERLVSLGADELVDCDLWAGIVGPCAEILGPASLAYVDGNCFRASSPDPRIELRSSHDDRVLALIEACGAAEARESGIVQWTSPLFTIEESGAAIAASGYTVWSRELAHLGVLTHPGWRGRGLARAVAGAAIAHALRIDLVAQWRARLTLTASRQVARSLGFIELGHQLSLRLSPADG